MTEVIRKRDGQGDGEPTTELRAGGRSPVRQVSMYQSVAWPLRALALLSVDLEEVARRLGLTLESSWDSRGSVRTAFFVLDGTDFVVTHHEGDAPGTHVWTRSGGPVDSAARVGSVLAALGVGPEAVSYSTWGAGTGDAHMPAAWGRGWDKPTRSHQDVWAHFKKRPGMFVGRVTFDAVVGFLNGYDTASEGALLDGFREWLATKLGYGWNLVYWLLAEKLVFPDGRPEEPWSRETEEHAVAGLLALIDEFFDHLADGPKDRTETV
ncbi:hypothetical protein AB0A69_09110 [Streptomyces sp. NPDC045431]|uniref:hypothetical protein n=1 Tax=Streptomyces sp. NPDC045431 TaxID=3155613 RepID=UPI00341100E8